MPKGEFFQSFAIRFANHLDGASAQIVQGLRPSLNGFTNQLTLSTGILPVASITNQSHATTTEKYYLIRRS
jgi:hypothetical protein